MIKPTKKYDLVSISQIIKSEKTTKGLVGTLSNNPNQMNRLQGYLNSGEQVIIAQRPGKGGMDFNKLITGKAYAVAADAFSPVFEKGEDKKPTKIQKVEDGLPMFSSSGFYLLSSKEYPALELYEAYTLLDNKGELAYLITENQLKNKQKVELSSSLDKDILISVLIAQLEDKNNSIYKHEEDVNKKRNRNISRAKEECEDANEPYEGISFEELKTNKKDGNPILICSWNWGKNKESTIITRQVEKISEEGRVITEYLSAEEAVNGFFNTEKGTFLNNLIETETEVEFTFAQGNAIRTSVSFKRKVENAVNAGLDKVVYGDAVYIKSVLKNWTKSIVSLMYSQHPNFPKSEYTALNFVVALRQAEVGLNKINDKWSPPEALNYDIENLLAT